MELSEAGAGAGLVSNSPGIRVLGSLCAEGWGITETEGGLGRGLL